MARPAEPRRKPGRPKEADGTDLRDRILDAAELEPVEQDHLAAKECLSIRHRDSEEGLGRADRVEVFALDRPVDDLLGQFEREEIEGHGRDDDEEQPRLLQTRVLPDEFEKIAFQSRGAFALIPGGAPYPTPMGVLMCTMPEGVQPGSRRGGA